MLYLVNSNIRPVYIIVLYLVNGGVSLCCTWSIVISDLFTLMEEFHCVVPGQ